MDKRYENGANGEPVGLPADLFTDPGKYDEQIPLWRRTVGFIKNFERSKPKGQATLLEQLASYTIKNLTTLDQLLDNFSLLGQIRPELDLEGMREGFTQQLEHTAARRSSLISWTPDKIEQLTLLGLNKSGPSAKAAVRIQAALYNAPQTVEESVALQYNAAWAMVTTQNTEVRKELFSTLCLEKPWFIPASTNALCFQLGHLAEDDRIFQHYSSVFEALNQVGVLIAISGTELLSVDFNYLKSRRVENRNQRVEEILADLPTPLNDHYKNLKNRLSRQLTYKLLAQKNNHAQVQISSKGGIDGTIRRDIDPEEPLRLKVIGLIGPQLSAITREFFILGMITDKGLRRLTRQPVQLPSGASLDILATGYESPEQSEMLVREIFEALSAGKVINPNRSFRVLSNELGRDKALLAGTYDENELTAIMYVLSHCPSSEQLGRLSSILEYHRPLMTLEQVRRAENQIAALKDDVQNKFVKSVHKRGYFIIISDPILRQLGYETITFKKDPNCNAIQTTISIDRQSYSFLLSSDYQVQLGEDLKQFASPQDQAWLELLILSHLKRLVCTGEDEEELKSELVAGEKQQAIYKRQQVHRTEHLRKQKPGWNYSTESFNRCLKSHLPIKSLQRINQMRAEIGWGGTKETGIWTYVSGVEKDIDTQTAKPVRVAFKKAAEDIRQVIPLGEVSAEELIRVEQEILGELEIN